MLKKLYIDNFKSLIEFSFPPKSDVQQLSAFSCLVGLNGAGKSTMLQAFDFIAQLPVSNTRIDQWLEKRNWKARELTSKFSLKSIITFSVELEYEGRLVVWSGTFNKDTLKCTSESVSVQNETIFSVQQGKLFITKEGTKESTVVKDLMYQGSILSIRSFDLKKYPAIAAIKQFSEGMKSLELLNPQLIRTRAREAHAVGVGGEKLAAFFHTLSPEIRATILRDLKIFYPNVTSLSSTSFRAGWKSLKVTESFITAAQNTLETETIHLNDGMLRILTMITEMHTSHTCILLDEIENGINPELVERLMDYLVQSNKQVIVTTHSPMVLNYLEDEVAEKGVFLIYRTKQGHTQCGRYFQSKRTRDKLTLLGPGEVFADTSMEEVAYDLELASAMPNKTVYQ